jgi:hypothetical protein
LKTTGTQGVQIWRTSLKPQEFTVGHSIKFEKLTGTGGSLQIFKQVGSRLKGSLQI